MISIYWGKPGDGMKLDRVKAYPKPSNSQPGSRPNSIPVR